MAGINPCESREVGHPKVLTAAGRSGERRCPVPIGPQKRRTVALQEPDDHPSDDASAHGTQVEDLCHDLRLLEDVLPQRRRRIEVKTESAQLLQAGAAPPWRADMARDPLAGRQLPGQVTKQVALRERSA